MIDFTRRRFLFGLAAVPLVVPAVKHFLMPKFDIAALVEKDIDLSLEEAAARGIGACTDFGTLSPARAAAWAEQVWKQGREASFFFGLRDDVVG